MLRVLLDVVGGLLLNNYLTTLLFHRTLSLPPAAA